MTFSKLRAMLKLFTFATVMLSPNGLPVTTHAQKDTAQRFDQFNSLTELLDRHSALLLVTKATVVDPNNLDKSIIEEALQTTPERSKRFGRIYGTIAQSLNKYIRKHQSLRATEDFGDADFIIFFHLLEYRFPLGTPYPYGELFIITNERSAAANSRRIIWRSRVVWAGDAIKDFVKDLRIMRGES